MDRIDIKMPNVSMNPFELSGGWGWQVIFQLLLAYFTFRITVWATRKGLLDGAKINHIQDRIEVIREQIKIRWTVRRYLGIGANNIHFKGMIPFTEAWVRAGDHVQMACDFANTHREELTQREVEALRFWPTMKSQIHGLIVTNREPKEEGFIESVEGASEVYKYEIVKLQKELRSKKRLIRRIKMGNTLF